MKKGFTLIELLAVIVVLGLILSIAIPKVVDVVTESGKQTFESNTRLLLKKISSKMKENSSFDVSTIDLNYLTQYLNAANTNYQSILVKKIADEPFIILVGKDRWAGYTAYGFYDHLMVVNSTEYTTTTIPPTIVLNGSSSIIQSLNIPFSDPGVTITDDIDTTEYLNNNLITINKVDLSKVGVYNIIYTAVDSSGNYAVATRIVNVTDNVVPELETGMIPVYYDEVARVWKKADVNNVLNNWFDYKNQRWANVVTVTSANRAGYMNAAVGTTITTAHINTMIVWIPRFKYLIPTGTGVREIKIVFQGAAEAKAIGDGINTYFTHPAFTFGTKELGGIWVGKFETTGTLSAITILPGQTALKNQTVKDMYESVRTNMQSNTTTYGFDNNNDIHMMKNEEWGAVAYLSGSKYGKYGNTSYSGANKEVYLNNSTSYVTGRSMGAPSGSGLKTPTYEYIAQGYYTYDGTCASIHANLPAPCNTGSTGQVITDKTLAYGASTTGNITGVFDMSGGTAEYVMGVYKPSTLSGIRDCSGYSISYAPPTVCPTVAPYDSGYENLTIDTKYYYPYTTTTASTSCNGSVCKGHALSETTGWYNDYTSVINETSPWYMRGGRNSNLTSAGIFAYTYATGQISSYMTMRITIAP